MSLTAAFLLLVTAGCGDDGNPRGDGSTGPTSDGTGAGRPLVVDTDLASDDLVALLFLLSSSEVDVRAVTVSGTGEVRCPRGLEIAAGLLAVTGHDDVPVACGRSTPLSGDHTFPAEWRDAADAAWGVDLPVVEAPDAAPSAAQLLAETLSTGRVTLLTLGPLTNPAEAFRADPDLPDTMSSMVIMGGAVDVGGNVYTEEDSSPSAEWNLYVDPVAAEEVLASGAPVTLVGLDATNQAPITPEFVGELQGNVEAEAAAIASQLLANNPLVASGEAYFWDPLAAAVVVDPDVVTTERAPISVVTTRGSDNGRTVRDRDGHQVQVAVGADVKAVEDLLTRTLNAS
ncbi:MAG TPA: nucleoside hydrolase [Nocardioides sp.]|uniref:nucleoside hydrolase n=1 Tax=Nocardioides sp. TaxID=35761 RepID=UPI002C5820D3|nr:nucleoside hydrolase [Nocardioides sp.]HQR25432.1 nucleoside hydrolase [Nocardioides sp.]